MKKFLLFAILFSFGLSAQEKPALEVDTIRIPSDDKEYIRKVRGAYIYKINPNIVLPISKPVPEAYTLTKNFIMETYNSPDDVIVAEIENDYFRYRGFGESIEWIKTIGPAVPFGNMRYMIEVRFREGRFRLSFSYELQRTNILGPVGTYQDWTEGPLEFIPYTRTGAVRGLELANYKRAYDFILNQALLLQAYINSGGGITEEEDW